MMLVMDAIRSFIELGGPVVAVLLLMSVFALALILLKLFQFWRERVGSNRRGRKVLEAWQQGDAASARSIVEGGHGAVNEALRVSMAMRLEGQQTKEQIEDEVARLSIGRLHESQRGLRALDAIAQIAPLLGLFGTVLGMIDAFQALQDAGNVVDPSILAGGIWVALMTTAVGLAVAMPVSLFLTWFETRLENERVAIETLTAGVLSVTQPGPISAEQERNAH